MSKPQANARSRGWIAIVGAAALVVPWSLVQAGKTIQEHRTADPQGEIEIVNVSGTIEVDGWDRSEVEVSGSAGDGVERVDVTSSGNRTTIRVVPRSRCGEDSDGRPHLNGESRGGGLWLETSDLQCRCARFHCCPR